MSGATTVRSPGSQAAQPARAAEWQLPAEFLQIIRGNFSDAITPELFQRFLLSENYDPSLVAALIAGARNPSAWSWELRCAAILMLEHQLLLLQPDANEQQINAALKQIDLIDESTRKVHYRVLGEGYSSTEPLVFWNELRTHLRRLQRLHRLLEGAKTSASALHEFIAGSRKECKLSLARYFFSPQEVAARIFQQVRISRGRPQDSVSLRRCGLITLLPRFERELLEELMRSSRIYWVASGTPSELNSLVEYPCGTVVLAIKPPGSDWEFEIKRAGVREERLLNVIFKQEEKEVPDSHRLWGGSTAPLLQSEANSVRRFAAIYRDVHGSEPPMSEVLGTSAIATVPNGHGEADIFDYFTTAEVFGNGYAEMREAMRQILVADSSSPEQKFLPGPLGQTVDFLSHYPPQQAVLAGSSSFRLDALDAYLQADGDRKYFESALKRTSMDYEKRQLADELLEEILGVYVPPSNSWKSYEDYLNEAFTDSANRQTADSNYLDLLKQAATVWGTMLAIGGYSDGESFTPRNAGLRSRWKQGSWKIDICLMDNDCLTVTGSAHSEFRPGDMVMGMMRDDGCLVSHRRNSKNSVERLQSIYRVNPAIIDAGSKLFREALMSAYTKTLQAMLRLGPVRKHFSESYLQNRARWEALVCAWLEEKKKDPGFEGWAAPPHPLQGFSEGQIIRWMDALKKGAQWLEQYSFLYTPRYFSRSFS